MCKYQLKYKFLVYQVSVLKCSKSASVKPEHIKILKSCLNFLLHPQLQDVQEAQIQGSLQDGDRNGVEVLPWLLRGRLQRGATVDHQHSGQWATSSYADRWWTERR